MTLTCLTCKKKGFRSLDEMQYHAEEHHAWCTICKTTFPDAAAVQAHRQDRPYTCTFCFRCFAFKLGLEDHIKTATAHGVKEKGLLQPKSSAWGVGPYFGCNLCSEQYQALHQLQHHRREGHAEFFGTAALNAVSTPASTTKPSPSKPAAQSASKVTPPKPSSSSSTQSSTKPLLPSRAQNDTPSPTQDAQNYIDLVRKHCHDRPHIYQQFLHLITELSKSHTNASDIQPRLQVMFKVRPVLLDRFQLFVEGFGDGGRPSTEGKRSEGTVEGRRGGDSKMTPPITPERTPERKAEHPTASAVDGGSSRKKRKRKETAAVETNDAPQTLDNQTTTQAISSEAAIVDAAPKSKKRRRKESTVTREDVRVEGGPEGGKEEQGMTIRSTTSEQAVEGRAADGPAVAVDVGTKSTARKGKDAAIADTHDERLQLDRQESTQPASSEAPIAGELTGKKRKENDDGGVETGKGGDDAVLQPSATERTVQQSAPDTTAPTVDTPTQRRKAKRTYEAVIETTERRQELDTQETSEPTFSEAATKAGAESTTRGNASAVTPTGQKHRQVETRQMKEPTTTADRQKVREESEIYMLTDEEVGTVEGRGAASVGPSKSSTRKRIDEYFTSPAQTRQKTKTQQPMRPISSYSPCKFPDSSTAASAKVITPQVTASAVSSTSTHPTLNATTSAPTGSAAATPSTYLDATMKYISTVKKEYSKDLTVYNQFLAIVKHLQDDTMPVPDVIECARNVLHARPALLKGFTVLLPSAYLAPSQGSAGVEVSKDGHHMEKGDVVVIDLETLEETTMQIANGLDAASRFTQSREKSQAPEEAVPEDHQRQPVHAEQLPISATVASGAGSAESQVHDDSLAPLAKTKTKSSSRSEGKKQKRKKSGRTSEPLGEEDVQKTKKRKVDRPKGKESSVNPTSANGVPSRLAPPSMPQATVDLFLCSVCNTTIGTLDDLKHHLLTSCTYASGSQMAEAQGFSCHTCEKRFSHPQEFEAHLMKKKRHMRVRSRKSKKKAVPQYNDSNLKTQAKRDIEHLPTPPRRPASSPPRHNRHGESQTPARPAPRSEPISPSLEEVIGVEDCTMYCRQCDDDFLTVEALVDHFSDIHGDDTSYCYTCAETFTKPHLLWPHLYTSPRHECAPPGTKFEFSSTAYRWEALMNGQRCSGEAPIDTSAASETRKRRMSRVKLCPEKPTTKGQTIEEDIESNPFL